MENSESTSITDTAAAVIAEYDRIVHSNTSPEWDAVAMVAADEEGEAIFEAWETADEMGIVLTDDLRDAIGDALVPYRQRLAEEVAAR